MGPGDPSFCLSLTVGGDTGQGAGHQHGIATAQQGSVTQSVWGTQSCTGAWRKGCLGTSRDSNFGRDINIFTVEEGQGIRREVLCSRFELSTDRFRKKNDNSHPEIIG